METFLPKIASAYVPVTCIVILLILGSFAGAGIGMEMPVHCPLMGMVAVCQMNALEHIAAWQQMFASVLANNASSVLLLLIVFFALSLQHFRRLLIVPVHVNKNLSLRARIPAIYNPLQEAFSSGILHPKIF